MIGKLGSGKTRLAKGMISTATGVSQDEVVSPTFTLMNVYENGKLVHIDTYRLENADGLLEIGVEDYLGQADTITIVEWPEKIKNLLDNKKTIEISIVKQDDNSREISITPELLG